MISIEQTLAFFTPHSKQTMEMRGMKTVNICTSTKDTTWATLAVTVCVDGTKLPPMLIFKSKHNGKMNVNEFPTFTLAATTIVMKMYRWMRV